jgi:hypothetical protein
VHSILLSSSNESVEKVQLKSGTHVRMLFVAGSDYFSGFTYCR